MATCQLLVEVSHISFLIKVQLSYLFIFDVKKNISWPLDCSKRTNRRISNGVWKSTVMRASLCHFGGKTWNNKFVVKLFLLKAGTCLWNMSLEHVPETCPWNMSLKDVPGTWPWNMSLEYVSGTWPWNMSLEHDPGTCPWKVSLEYVPKIAKLKWLWPYCTEKRLHSPSGCRSRLKNVYA